MFARVRQVSLAVLISLVGLGVFFSTRTTTAPEDPTVYLDANRAQGRSIQALYNIQAIALQTGWTSALHRTAGDLAAQVGDLTRAMAHWEAVVALEPADAAFAQRLAQIYLDRQYWSQASRVLERLSVLQPADAWTHFQAGLVQAAFDPPRAADHLQHITADAAYQPLANELLDLLQNALPDAVTALQVGFILVRYEQWPYAAVAFEHATALEKDFAEAWGYYALARDQQGQDARPMMAQALALAPENPQILYLYGLHLRRLGDETASLGAFALAAQFEPANPAYAAELGAAYQRSGQLDLAETWLQKALELSNGDARFQTLLEAFRAQATEPVSAP